MTSGSLYNLTWGEYGTSLISAVQLLRCHDELVDVTLAAGGRTFHAHKVVLCAASPFLLDLLKSTTCKHPVVMLAGVQASDLEALLEFVYRGEVSVDPNQLPSLLQAAHCLNIQGLSPSTIAINNSTLQPNIKHEVITDCEIPQTTAFLSEGNDTGVKKKKRNKRASTSPTSNKWSKVFVAETTENITMQSQDDSSNSWSQQGGNIGTTLQAGIIDAQPLQQQMIVQNMPVSVGISVQTKTRGASDQPGACPLCGAMLRQARNLRRHLITSCKYRMINNMQTSATTTTTTTNPTQTNSNERIQQHQEMQQTPQETQLEMQQINQNDSSMDCNNLMPTTSSLLSMQ